MPDGFFSFLSTHFLNEKYIDLVSTLLLPVWGRLGWGFCYLKNVPKFPSSFRFTSIFSCKVVAKESP
jgi:hypothetical protein